MIWVVVGGQYGSEGKGAFCAYIARGYGFRAAVRGGGPQAGHTFWDYRYGKSVVRQVPVAAVVDKTCVGYIGPGAVVNPKVLESEMDQYGLWGRVWVHPAAIAVTEEYMEFERRLAAGGPQPPDPDWRVSDKRIPGSTLEGVGAARARRALRMATPVQVQFLGTRLSACIDDELERYREILGWATGHERVMAEGAQGFGLSLFHGVYPFVTSADTTPAAVLSECGLPVFGTERVIMVLRTFPIRVGGNSGPFASREMTWGDVGVEPERTTVTGRERRIAEFEWAAFDRVLEIARPNYAALAFCDYLDPEIKTRPMSECPRVWDFWREVHKRVTTPWIGVGGPEYEFRGAMEGVVAPGDATFADLDKGVHDGKD